MRIQSLNSETGVTLVEVLVALILVALVILGGGMFFVYARVHIVHEAHRRAVTVLVAKRLETLKAADYSNDLAPSGFDPGLDAYYIKKGSSWDHFETLSDDSYEYVTVDNPTRGKMLTELQYQYDTGNEYLQAAVTVEWTDHRTDTVTCTSLISPYNWQE